MPRYATLRREEIYPGIGYAAYGAGPWLEYDFIVAPRADPNRIRMHFEGAGALVLTPAGDLQIGAFKQRKPILYQLDAAGRRQAVEGRFKLVARNTAGISTGKYDGTRTLYVDPVLESTTFWGGAADDSVIFAVADGMVAGTTASPDLPGAYSRRRGQDVFVQFPGVGMLIFGGSGDDVATSASLTRRGSEDYFTVAGYTNSTDLPTTVEVRTNIDRLVLPAPQRSFAGGVSDGFVLMFRVDHSGRQNFPNTADPRLPYLATYLGSPGEDRITAICSDGSGGGTITVAGTTDSDGLTGTYENGAHGGKDGFLAVLRTFSNSISGTYIGGSSDDEVTACAAAGGDFILGGETRSADFPGVSERGGLNGESDAFLWRFAPQSTQVRGYSVFGGSGRDRVTAIAGELFRGGWAAAGYTSSTDFPLTNPFQPAYGGGEFDAFIMRFGQNSLTPELSTYLGGAGADQALAVAIVGGQIAAGGRTASPKLATRDAIQPEFGGGADDGWFARIDGIRSPSSVTSAAPVPIRFSVLRFRADRLLSRERHLLPTCRPLPLQAADCRVWRMASLPR